MTTPIVVGPSRIPATSREDAFLPGDHLTTAEAALILGCSVTAVERHLRAGRLAAHGADEARPLERVDVERLASEIFPWRRQADAREPYWVTGQRAADILGVSRSRLGQLADARRVPHMRHQDGTRLYRRLELVTLRHERSARA